MALFVGVVPDFNVLATLMTNFKVNMAGIDHEPEWRLANAFAEKFAGRVYLLNYAHQKLALMPNKEMHTASARRVEAMDAAFEGIRNQSNHLPQNLHDDYAKHLMSNVRVVETDDVGRTTVQYRKVGGADDYAHAEVYDLLATELWYWERLETEAQEEHFEQLDERLDFERATLGSAGAEDYDPGFETDRYGAGFEE